MKQTYKGSLEQNNFVSIFLSSANFYFSFLFFSFVTVFSLVCHKCLPKRIILIKTSSTKFELLHNFPSGPLL